MTQNPQVKYNAMTLIYRIVDNQIEYLLLEKNPQTPGKEKYWTLPGGSCDGQSFLEAATREGFEETGLAGLVFFTNIAHSYQYSTTRKENGQAPVTIQAVAYAALTLHDEVDLVKYNPDVRKDNDNNITYLPHTAYRWVSQKQAQELLCQIAKYKETLDTFNTLSQQVEQLFGQRRTLQGRSTRRVQVIQAAA